MLASFDFDSIINILSWVWIIVCLILFIYYQYPDKFHKSQYFLKGVTNRIYLSLFICIGFAFQRDYILAILWFIVALLGIRSKRLFLSDYIIEEVDRISSEILKIDRIVGALNEEIKISRNRILYIENRIGSRYKIMGKKNRGTREITDSMEIRKEWVSELLSSIQNGFENAQTMGEVYIITEILEVLNDLKMENNENTELMG